jgi:uncharacterized protein YdaU (DUF1376 family)
MAEEKDEQKVYMPLMIGDWLKGTRGMKAEIRGVYLSLLLYQWDNGFIPSDMEELCLIDPELPKVWDKIKVKFIEFEPGKLKNKMNEDVKNFWKKQKANGKKGGRPKSVNPEVNPEANPTVNPETNPNHNLHNDIDLDSDSCIELNKKESVQKIESSDFKYEFLEDESLADCETWTAQIIEGNDMLFLAMVRNNNITLNGQLERMARDHLGLCARYNWHEKLTSQQAFRQSLVGHIRKELDGIIKKQAPGKKLTIKDLDS